MQSRGTHCNHRIHTYSAWDIQDNTRSVNMQSAIRGEVPAITGYIHTVHGIYRTTLGLLICRVQSEGKPLQSQDTYIQCMGYTGQH